ncbi:hypothetical protein [Pedobacter sp. AJM]|uniref:hypothetical protein n=1 Tax=Pedobacter sp. AJM TaxID=2003629 RepID=UPI000B4A7D88|nr:hypothetical protein [Pedobacter sp. AJM]OWK71399.1 hypothetical protein CBW18_10095 [Pedobacter sp. AJM]
MIRVFITKNNAVKDHYSRVCNDSRVRTLGLTSIINRKINDTAPHEAMKIMFYTSLLLDLDPLAQENLITGKPAYLQGRIDHYETNFTALLTDDFKKEVLEKVFFYSNYKKWEAYKLAEDLSTNVCPYCNRQYIFTLSGNAIGNIRPQFDHFFDKATYPYLSMSFYNLVPSCAICNSDLKGSAKFTLQENIHPYLEDFSGLSFSIRPKNVDFINGKSSAYRIRFRNTGGLSHDQLRKCFSNISVFQLSKLYNRHKDHSDELIIKSRIYNQAYIEALFNQFNGTLFKDLNDVKRLVSSNYTEEKDFEKRPLSKMTADICRELGLFM